jgi:aerobic carbon-monoxide dehydrogenase medium subunit
LKPPRFAYFTPVDAEDALALVDEHDDAKVLAGGQSLVPMLSMRLAYPATLVDINNVRELDFVSRENGHLRLGALTRHAHVEDSGEIAALVPLLAKAMPWVGHRAIRNRGTLGGTLAHADPAAEVPAALTALEATIVARSTRGLREFPASELFAMPLVSTLEPDELLVEVRVPVQDPGDGSAVVEVAKRHGDFALAGVMATVRVFHGSIDAVRLVAFAVGSRPQRLADAEVALIGTDATPAAFAAASAAAAAEVMTAGDIHATAEYRRRVISELVRRALTEAVADTGERRR